MRGIIRFLSDYIWSSQQNFFGVGLSVLGSHREISVFKFFFDTSLQAIEFYSAGETAWFYYYY